MLYSYDVVALSGGPTSFKTGTSSQSAQDVPVAPMSCITFAITEVFFADRPQGDGVFENRAHDEALPVTCRRNLDIKRRHTPA